MYPILLANLSSDKPFQPDFSINNMTFNLKNFRNLGYGVHCGVCKFFGHETLIGPNAKSRTDQPNFFHVKSKSSPSLPRVALLLRANWTLISSLLASIPPRQSDERKRIATVTGARPGSGSIIRHHFATTEIIVMFGDLGARRDRNFPSFASEGLYILRCIAPQDQFTVSCVRFSVSI